MSLLLLLMFAKHVADRPSCRAAQIIFYSPVLFSSLGSSQTTALLSTVIVGAVNVLSTLVAVFGVDKFGRRILLLEAGVQVWMQFLALRCRIYIN